MTFEVAMGVVAAVYSTPLPEVFDMPLCSIAAYASMAGRIISLTDPMAGDGEEERVMSADELRRMLSR